MSNQRAVWIDHREAHIFHVDPGNASETTLTAKRHLHRKYPRGTEGPIEHPEYYKKYFREVADALVGAEEVLIIGPSTAKLDFLRYIHKHDHNLEAKIIGVEKVDHPTYGEIAAYALKYFGHADNVR